MQAVLNKKITIEGVTLTMTLKEAKLLHQLANTNALEIGARERGVNREEEVADLSEAIYESLQEVKIEPQH